MQEGLSWEQAHDLSIEEMRVLLAQSEYHQTLRQIEEQMRIINDPGAMIEPKDREKARDSLRRELWRVQDEFYNL